MNLSTSLATPELPVAIVGAGPIGLAAAAHLYSKGQPFVVFEAGEGVGQSVLSWGHVRLFSPWRYLTDPVAASLLATSGWTHPNPEALPTGRELLERYLTPLAALPALEPHLRLQTRVVGVARKGFEKLKSAGREAAPFELEVQDAAGQESRVLASAVIDASGTTHTPNPLGAGLPVINERAFQAHLRYGLPDVLGAERARYAGRRVLVVGAGHSAFNVLLDLGRLAEQEPDTQVVWAARKKTLGSLFGGEAADMLPARGALGARLRRLVEEGRVSLETGFLVERLERAGGRVTAVSGDKRVRDLDEIVVCTGFRPDLRMFSELRLALDPALESPTALAPLIDPNVHSCGTVPPHGAHELAHPETGVYIVGMKSYGRAPTFLLLTGYEQVRSVVCALTGDAEGARAVELLLPETGVCSTDAGGSCCAPQTLPHRAVFEGLGELELLTSKA